MSADHHRVQYRTFNTIYIEQIKTYKLLSVEGTHYYNIVHIYYEMKGLNYKTTC